ncbi:MAG: helix-turn-helix transcriptional regulator [Planctomycetota bacterium]
MSRVWESGTFACDAVEAIGDAPGGWRDEMMQLSSGSLGLRVAWTDMRGLSVWFYRYGAAARIVSERVDDSVVFNLVLAAEGEPRCAGRTIPQGVAHVTPVDASVDYVLRARTEVLAVVVSRAEADARGWPRALPTLLRVPRGLAPRLVHDASAGRRGRILEELDAVLTDASACAGRPQRGYEIVRRAEAWHRTLDPAARPAMTRLAAELGISVSSLHRAFESWAGVSPGRYFAIERLHRFRRRLCRNGPRRGAVTRAALDCGFEHLGRLSADYRRQFGESPRDTLRSIHA